MFEQILGYDIRVPIDLYVEKFWTNEMRASNLLIETLRQPLTVDCRCWSSFLFFREPGDLFLIDDCIIHSDHEGWYRDMLNLWQNLEAMKNFFLERKKKYGLFDKKEFNGVIVAATLNTDVLCLALPEWKVFDIWLNEITELPKDWQFLGYDVADKYKYSGLCDFSYKADEKKELQAVWGSCLNEFGLFKDMNDALAFVKVANEILNDHAPFFVYGLYRAPYEL